MNGRLGRLADRRARLIAQAEMQRRTLSQDIEPWRTPLAFVDQGVVGLRYIRRHPEWIVGGLILLAALRPRRFVKWLGRGWVSWRLAHRLSDMYLTVQKKG